MVGKAKTKKPEGVAGSKGLPSSSQGNPPVHSDDKVSKEKGKFNEGKGVKKDESVDKASMGLQDSSVNKGPVLDQSNVESHTDDPDLGLSSVTEKQLEPVYAFDASGELVQIADRKILSQLWAEFQKKAPRQNQDDSYVYNDGDEFDAQEQRETFRAWLRSRLIMPDGNQPDKSPAPESPDLKEQGSSSSNDPPEEDSLKGLEGTLLSTKKNKNKQKNKKKEKQKESVVMPEEERKEPNAIKCVLCKLPSENMHRASKCGHRFCTLCIQAYIFNNMKPEDDLLVSLPCPGDCPEILSDEEIFTYLGERYGFSWLMAINRERRKQVREGFTRLKIAAALFMRTLNEIS